MDFLEQLKAMVGGGAQKPPMPDDLNEERPWDSPSLQTARPIQPMPPEPPGPPPPTSPMEEAVMRARMLEKQKRMAASMIPEGSWNR